MPADKTALRDFIISETTSIEEAMRDDLAGALRENDPLLIEVIEYALFGGGKRIRPLLAILAARVCALQDDSIYRLAAAFEYLHVATLVHDDVIDNAKERRGRPSAGEKYGIAAAILAGDWLHARSMHLVGRYGGQVGLGVFCRSTAGMVDGEFLQLRYAADCEITEEQYFAVIHRKTALLIESTCEIGALFAGADEKQRSALTAYGHKLGNAFQVIDDLLDYCGDRLNTGKKTGNDFAEGKVTLPLIRALKAADDNARKHVVDLFSGDRKDPEAYAVLSRMIDENGGFESARDTAESLIEGAIADLDVFSETDDPEGLAMLHGIARYVLKRDR